MIPALDEKALEVERSADGAEGLDLMLPGLEGRSFLRHLRQDRQVSVLVLVVDLIAASAPAPRYPRDEAWEY